VVRDEKLLSKFLYGTHRQFNDLPERSARAKATIQNTQPWQRGRVGRIEERIFDELMLAKNHTLTTGELVRRIYCGPWWAPGRGWRKPGDPPSKVEHWMYDQIRKAAPTFADRVGGGRGRGGIVWRLRRDQFFWDAREEKTRRDAERRKAKKG
jgi:hypothetical protein